MECDRSSLIAAITLQHLDLIPVGVLQKEEPGHHFPFSVKLFDRVGVEAQFLKTGMFLLEIFDRHCNMTITVTVCVWFLLSMIDGQFDLKVVLFIPKIYQGKVIEGEPIRHLQSESFVVEVHRSFFIEYPDHCVNCFGHMLLLGN